MWGDNMKAFSLWEMFETIANLVLSSPIFLISFIVGVVLLIAMMISIKKTKRIGKTLTIVIYLFLIIFVLIYYNNYLYNLLDNLMNTIFTQIFFPNLAAYVIMLLTTLIILFYSIIKTNIPRYLRSINMITPFLIIFLFVLTLDVIISAKINIYEPLTVYSNKNLLVLIEFSMIIFTIWIILLLSIQLIRKIIKKSNKKIMNNFLKDEKKENKTEVLKL